MPTRRMLLACALLGAFLLLPRSASSDTSLAPLLTWGNPGSGPGQFNSPTGIAIDASGKVFVADGYGQRVQVFTRTGGFLYQFGSSGIGDGQFSNVLGLALDSAGNVYVCDSGNQRVQKFTNAGVFVAQWGTFGAGAGEFLYPQGIAVDAADNVYVTDGFPRVQKFTTAGGFVGQWGSSGPQDGQFSSPVGVTTDPDGNVYVADAYSHRVQKFAGDGTFITKWGTFGNGNGEFNSPIGIAASAGAVYVIESGNHRLQKFDHDGGFVTQLGSYGSALGHFRYPWGAAVDDSENVYVTDGQNYRVQRFGPRVAVRINVPGDQPDISSAIFAAGFGDTIVVAPGLYFGPFNTIGKAVVLTSNYLFDGDPATIAATVLDGQGSQGVLNFSSGEDAQTAVIGFTVRNGSTYVGGGVLCSNSSPRLEHLVVRDNFAYGSGGGGIAIVDGGAPQILACSITNNRAVSGGGIFINANQSVTIGTPGQRCTIHDNVSTQGAGNGSEIWGAPASMTVYADTFTTAHPDEEQIYPQPGATVDLLHAVYAPIAATDIYVSLAGDNGNDGLTPATPLRSIWNAMMRADSGTTIQIAPGIYGPSPTGERTLHTRSGVSLVGADSATCVIDGEFQMAILYASDDHDFQISDLTMRNGDAANGALYLFQSNPEIRRCAIRNHVPIGYTNDPVAILCLNSTPVIDHCTISNGDVVGILCRNTNATITHSQFLGNLRGGIVCTFASSALIQDNLIQGAPNQYVSGITLQDNSDAQILNNEIVSNRAQAGGGIMSQNSNPTIRGNRIAYNIAYGGYGIRGGGGIWCGNSAATIDSNVFEGNQAVGGSPDGGALFVMFGLPSITRNTFHGNIARDTTGQPLAVSRGGAIFIDSGLPVIGGAIGLGNTFDGNQAVQGSDLVYVATSGPPTVVNARFNHFRVFPATDYYAHPISSFDVTGGTGDFAPLAQDAYVASVGSDLNDGTTPGTPLRTIQSALSRMIASETQPLTIHIAPGTYSPSSNGEVFPLSMSSYLSLVGDDISPTILDAQGKSGVIVCDGATPLTIKHLRIQGGKSGAGGGIFCRATACSLVANTIRNNSAFWGGGIYCTEGGNPIIVNNVITSNRAQGPNYFARIGGGIAAHQNAHPKIVNNLILFNISQDSGGGVLCWNQSATTLVNNTIAFNLAGGNGGGLNAFDSAVEIRSCIIHDNISAGGGDDIGGTADSLVAIGATYSDIGGGWPGSGNIDVDPVFDGSSRFLLTAGSPCIDAGSVAVIDNDPENPSQPGFALVPALGTTRNDMGAYGGPGAGGFKTDVPTATMASLYAVVAAPGRVKLTWNWPAASSATCTVYRRAIGADWSVVGTASADGSGMVVFEDRNVTAGDRLAYRLGVPQGGIEELTDEILVRVPSGLSLALEGLRPNPARARIMVSFTLPSAMPAKLELLDIQGRRMRAQDVGTLGPGQHTLSLGNAGSVAPGLYFLRLTQGPTSLTSKAVIAR